MSEPIILNDAAAAKADRRAEIDRVRLIDAPTYNDRQTDWPAAIVESIRPQERVLDVGKSSRDAFEMIRARAAAIETLDINVWDGYPDLVADLCQPLPESRHGAYDVVIALAVLECVYDPQAMIDNIFRLLKPGGRAYLYAPFIYQYHAPRDLAFQDNYRFSRDGLAYLLRGFEGIEMQAVRGQYSTIANLLPSWKVRVEKRFGGGIGRWLDRIAEPRRNVLDASGYNVTAFRPA